MRIITLIATMLLLAAPAWAQTDTNDWVDPGTNNTANTGQHIVGNGGHITFTS